MLKEKVSAKLLEDALKEINALFFNWISPYPRIIRDYE